MTLKSLVSQKQNKSLSFTCSQLNTHLSKNNDNVVNANQLNYAKLAKEIVAAVVIFDPLDKSHDFMQTWQVLLCYGKSNYFQEKDKIDMLFHISRGDAKTILIEFDRLNKSLRQILDHFASIYSVRRSLVSDRRAVENFTSKKGELLEAAMDHYDIILDKICHLHSEQAWPEVSRNSQTDANHCRRNKDLRPK